MPDGPMMETLGTLIERFDSYDGVIDPTVEGNSVKKDAWPLSNQSLAFAWTV